MRLTIVTDFVGRVFVKDIIVEAEVTEELVEKIRKVMTEQVKYYAVEWIEVITSLPKLQPSSTYEAEVTLKWFPFNENNEDDLDAEVIFDIVSVNLKGTN